MRRSSYTHAQTGFTMVEILVSVVIISIGLLGVAGMQVLAVRNSNGTSARSIAAQSAYDMADRMLANDLCFHDTVNINCSDSYNTAAGPPTVAPAADCINVACPQDTQIAAADSFGWYQRLQSTLPRGEGVVCRDSTPDDGVPTWSGAGGYGCDNLAASPWVVKVFWDQRQPDPSNGNATYGRFALTVVP
jgi:type IV pilus assembly protein PilV